MKLVPSRILYSLGIDAGLLRVLVANDIRMDFRGTGSVRRRSKVPPMVRSLFFYGLMGFLTAQTLAPRTGPFLYGFLVLSYSMVMTAFAVLLEFGTSIVHPDDSDVLGGLPIPPRTIFLARLINLLFYTFLIGTCLCLPPSLFGLAVREEPKWFPLVFFPVSLAANLAAASSMVLVYTLLLRLMRKERAKDVIAGMQIILSFVVFFSYQVAAGFGKTSFYGEDPAGSWLYALPSAWFAGAVQILLKTARPIDIHLALCALAGTVFLFGILFRNSSFDLVQVGDGKGTAVSIKLKAAEKGSAALVRPNRKSWERGIARLFPSKEAAAGFLLTSNMIRQDRSVKMGLYPLFGLPMAALALAIVQKDLTDPFLAGAPSSTSSVSTLFFFIFFLGYLFLRAVVYSREWEASWIYHTAPLESPGRFYRGVKAALWIRLMLPFFVGFTVVVCTQMPWVHGLMTTLTLVLFSLVVLSLGSMFIADYPFSRKRERGEQTQRFAAVLVLLPFFALAFFVHVLAFRSLWVWWTVQGGTMILALCLEALSTRRLDRVLSAKEGLV